MGLILFLADYYNDFIITFISLICLILGINELIQGRRNSEIQIVTRNPIGQRVLDSSRIEASHL